MSVAKIQKGDRVKVVSGNYRGTIGLVSALTKKKMPNGLMRVRVSVSEIPNIVDYRRSLRAYSMPGEMKTKERTIDISNVQLISSTGVVSRSKTEIREGKKVRILIKTGEVVAKILPTIDTKDEVNVDNKAIKNIELTVRSTKKPSTKVKK